MIDPPPSRKCTSYHDAGWTCTKHKTVSRREKYSFTLLGVFGSLLIQGLMTNAFKGSLTDFGEDPGSEVAVGLLLLILVVASVALVVRLDETRHWKYLVAGAGAPFFVLNAVLAPILRLAYG